MPPRADDALDIESAEPADQFRTARGLQELEVEVGHDDVQTTFVRVGVAVLRIEAGGSDFRGDSRERGPHGGVARRPLLVTLAHGGRQLEIASGGQRLHTLLTIGAEADVLREHGRARLGMRP